MSNDKNPTFVFSSLTGLTFDCSIDNVVLAACGAKGGDNRGSATAPNLADGTHTFRVRARDGGEFDRVPAVFTWVVDTVAPTATLGASGPGEGALQAVNRETFVFSSSEDSTFECQLDGAGFAPCASGITLEGLSASRAQVRGPGDRRRRQRRPRRRAQLGRLRLPQLRPRADHAGRHEHRADRRHARVLRLGQEEDDEVHDPSGQERAAQLHRQGHVRGQGLPVGLKGKGFTKTKAFGTVTLAKFIKKSLRAGDKITVTVSKPNAIAAVKVLTVRASKKPLIATKCVPPGTTKPVAC